MSDRELITPHDIFREAHAEQPVKEGTYLQRTGLRLAAGVGTLGSVVILALVIKGVYSTPGIPLIPSELDPEKARVMILNYKNLQQAALEPLTTIFDVVVVKVLLPVFTGILGYIYASKETKS